MAAIQSLFISSSRRLWYVLCKCGGCMKDSKCWWGQGWYSGVRVTPASGQPVEYDSYRFAGLPWNALLPKHPFPPSHLYALSKRPWCYGNSHTWRRPRILSLSSLTTMAIPSRSERDTRIQPNRYTGSWIELLSFVTLNSSTYIWRSIVDSEGNMFLNHLWEILPNASRADER